MLESLWIGRANGGYISRTKIEFVFYEMSLPWLNKLARKKRGETLRHGSFIRYRRTLPWAGTRWREGSKRGRAASCTKGQPRATETLWAPLSSRDRREEKKKMTVAASARAQTRASRGEAGFKSFTRGREISSSNQQRQF